MALTKQGIVVQALQMLTEGGEAGEWKATWDYSNPYYRPMSVQLQRLVWGLEQRASSSRASLGIQVTWISCDTPQTIAKATGDSMIVRIPRYEFFPTDASFVNALLHEFCHVYRLGKGMPRGKEVYAREEIIAETFAVVGMQLINMDDPQLCEASKDYVKHFMNFYQSHTSAMFNFHAAVLEVLEHYDLENLWQPS